MKRLLLLSIIILTIGCSEGSNKLKTGYIELEGSRLYYEEKGSGRPVIMIHGGMLDRRMWDDQFDLFAEKYRVIRYDVRAHGKSGGADSTFIDSEDLHVLVHQLDIESAAIFGLSMGGQIATDFAIAHPQRVSALILAGASVSGFNNFVSKEIVKHIENMTKALNEGDFEKWVEVITRAVADGPYRTPSEMDQAVREKILTMLEGSKLRWDLRDKAAFPDPPAIGRLDEIRCPILTLFGDKDFPEVMEISDLFKENVPGTRQVVIPDVAHIINMEKPEEFNRIVMEFLESIRY
ncbi:alpha/beta fold hydrolase [candidate division KSB1 bacterium]